MRILFFPTANRSSYRTWHEEHAWTASVGAIVHLAVSALSKIAYVHLINGDQPSLYRSLDDAHAKWTFKIIGKEREDIDLHCAIQLCLCAFLLRFCLVL